MVVLRRSTANRSTRETSTSRSRSRSRSSQSHFGRTLTTHDLDKPGKHRGRTPIHSPPVLFSRVAVGPPQQTSNKRPHSSTTALADRPNEQKRRKVETRPQPPPQQRHPQLQIPVRSRGGVGSKTTSPQNARPNAAVVVTTINTNATRPKLQPYDSVESPTPKPEYDRIKQIEEKARAAIQDARTSRGTVQDDRRKLRSEHGGSRSKTELAQYFPNFEEMLSLEPPDPEILIANTKIILVNDSPDYRAPTPQPEPFKAPREVPGIRLVDLIPSASFNPTTSDPLNTDVYLKIHQKAERHEKQMKNGDRERAQHEKYQLERLLDDLRGPDWLKTLGISGITDTEKKRYEPKRALFIRETNALINKFKWWKEEEKRRKLEREQQMMEATVDQAEVGDEEQDDDDEDEDDEVEDGEDETDDSSRSSSTPPAAGSSEIDALASQQLLEEAKSARRRKKVGITHIPEPPPYVAFTTFFAKRHLRDAAVHGRFRGRTLLAFGHPLPELLEEDFELPDSILTEDAIRDNQRSRRRRRRDIDSDG